MATAAFPSLSPLFPERNVAGRFRDWLWPLGGHRRKMPAPPHTASGERSSVPNTHGSGGEAANLRLDLGPDRRRAGLGQRRSRGHRLALCRGWPLYAGRRAVRAHAEHLRARHDQGHGLPLHRHALPASLRGVRPACQPAVRHPLGQQCRPVRAGLSRGQAQRLLRRHDHRRFGRLLSRRQPESADPRTISRRSSTRIMRAPTASPGWCSTPPTARGRSRSRSSCSRSMPVRSMPW